jgi:hypothetical protein
MHHLAKLANILSFEDGALPAPGHGTHHLPVAARRIEAPHHQVLEGRTRKLEQSAILSRSLGSSAETAITPSSDDLLPAPPSPDALFTHCPAHATFPMVLGTAARHRSARPLDICPPSSLTPLCLRWSQVARRSHFEWLADRVHVSLLPCSLQVSSVDGLPRQQVHTSPLHLQRPSVLSLGKDRARVRRATPTCRAASGAASQALELLNPFFVSRSQHGSGNRYPAHVPLNVRCRGDLRAERRWGRCLRGWERCDLFHTGLAPWWEATQLSWVVEV